MAFIQQAPIEWAPRRGQEEPVDAELFRASMRSLLLTSSVNDLPKADRRRPEVMVRLSAGANEADYALFGTMKRASQISREELDDIQRGLDEDPEMPKKIAEAIDEEALRGGVSLRRRLHFRRMAAHAVWRMKRQSVETLLTETLAKVERLTARVMRSEKLRLLLEPRPEDVLRWEAKATRVAARVDSPMGRGMAELAYVQDAAAPRVPPPPPPALTPPALVEQQQAPPPVEDPEAQARRLREAARRERARRGDPETATEYVNDDFASGTRLLRGGGIVTGIGVGLAILIGIPLWFSGAIGASLILWTVGGLMILIGVILMIVGAVRRSRT
jgi:hypothetical protein